MTYENELKKQFTNRYEHAPKHIFSAPGRVNIIGEHTDYNDGFVLPTAIDFRTWIAASPREDNIIEALALDETDANDQPTTTRFSLDEPLLRDPHVPWGDYLKGVTKELLYAGYGIKGANLAITGNVPRGAGLSSSAALENAVTFTLASLSNVPIDGVTAAKLGQAAENNFVGCQCGIMDQLISAKGKAGTAMLLDCRSLETRTVAFPKNCDLIVVNSNVKRGLVDSEYNTRREQCEEAARYFQVKALRDLDLKTLLDQERQMDEQVFRRARHVVSENTRTLAAADALAANDLATMSSLMFDSHESMKKDFEITVPHIDTLVDIIRHVIGDKGGVRMTGGGFGGCVIALVPSALKDPVIHAVENDYFQKTGLHPDIFSCIPSDGAFS